MSFHPSPLSHPMGEEQDVFMDENERASALWCKREFVRARASTSARVCMCVSECVSRLCRVRGEHEVDNWDF